MGTERQHTSKTLKVEKEFAKEVCSMVAAVVILCIGPIVRELSGLPQLDIASVQVRNLTVFSIQPSDWV